MPPASPHLPIVLLAAFNDDSAGVAVTESLPAFLVVIGIPFAWSIADGIALGFVAYPVLKILSGRPREASWLVYLLGAMFALRYALL